MGIGADDQIARAHDALLGQQRVLDAHAADLVVMRDALLTGEIARLFGLLGAFDVLIRDVVVGNQGDLSGIENLLHADLLEILNGDRRRDVVGKHQIEIALDQLPRLDFVKPRMCGPRSSRPWSWDVSCSLLRFAAPRARTSGVLKNWVIVPPAFPENVEEPRRGSSS